MSKFDRGVFIFIGLGVWAFVFIQIFEIKPLEANTSDHFHSVDDVAGIKEEISRDCFAYLNPPDNFDHRKPLLKISCF